MWKGSIPKTSSAVVERLEYYMRRTKIRKLLFGITIGFVILCPTLILAEEITGTFDLIQTIDAALEANLGLKRSKEEVKPRGDQKSPDH